MSSSTSKALPIMPHQTMRGHIHRVTGVVHLPGSGRRIITCSPVDRSLRLWDLDSGAQIGEDWREENGAGMWSMALSPNAKTVATGSGGYIDYNVRLWDVETRKVIAKWTGHTNSVVALCWSADGKRVASGSEDGTARVWDVNSGETVLTIKTGHNQVNAVMYSPDNEKIATGGPVPNGAKIWDSKTGKLITTLKHHGLGIIVFSLAWTSDGKKLISGSFFSIRIFDTTTWEQIAFLEDPTDFINVITLSSNNRFLASASFHKEVCLWNLDTNLSIGLPLQHEDYLCSAALSADGKVLVTGCENGSVYTWDIHAILKEAGLEDLLPAGSNIAPGPKDRLEQKASQGNSGIERTPRSSLSDKSFLEADATRCDNEFGGHVDELPPRFFDGMEAESSHMGDTHPHSSASALLARISSLLHRFRHDNAEATEGPHPSTYSGLHPRVLLARLSSLIQRSPPENDAANEPQQPSTPSRLDPDALIGRLSSLFRSQPHTNEEIELPHRPRRPHVVEVAPMRDREVLFVAPWPSPDRPHAQPNDTATPGARPAYPLALQLLAHLVLFLCCASPQHANGNVQPTQQQQDQSQAPVETQVSSLQTQPTAPSTSTIPTSLDNRTTAPGEASA